MSSLQVMPKDGVSSPETEIRKVGEIDWVFFAGEPIVELGYKKSLDNMWVHPEPGFRIGRCKMIKRTGERCRNAVRRGWSVCRHHGAGTTEKPGGRPPVTGRHSKYLPIRFLERYEEFLTDPDTLSMRSELALLDTRVGEVVERLDTADGADAWNKVRQAWYTLRNHKNVDDIVDAEGLLEDALESYAGEEEIWKEVSGLIEQRRKVADTERRRVIDAHQYLSYNEAQAMLAFVIDTVFTYVEDSQVRNAISDRLKAFSAKSRVEM